MNPRFLLALSLTVLLSVSLFAREKTDVIVMKNGDRMTCEIKGLEGGILYVSFDYIDGTTSVDWLKVARLESRQLFVVKTEDGAVYMGTLRTPETAAAWPVRIEVLQSMGEGQVMDRSHIVQMIATSDRFWQRFSGEVSFGTTYSKGNQSTQYRLGSQAAYVRQRWNAQASFDSNLSSSTGANVSTRNSMTVLANHMLGRNNWFYSGLASFLQSSEQGITLQSTLGSGVGRYLKNSNRARVAILGGIAWIKTDYQESVVPLGKQNLAAALIKADVSMFRFSKANLELTAVLLPALSDPGRVGVNTNATYYVKIFSDLKWNVSFYGNWDNRPPQGFSTGDYGTSSGLSWSFGLK